MVAIERTCDLYSLLQSLPVNQEANSTACTGNNGFWHLKPGSEFSAWKWVRAKLYSVTAIKMSRLAIDRLLILLSLKGSLRCCRTVCTNFLSVDTQDARRKTQDARRETRDTRHEKKFNCAQTKLCPKLLAFFKYAYLFIWWRPPIRSYDGVRLSVHTMAEIKWIHLIRWSMNRSKMQECC